MKSVSAFLMALLLAAPASADSGLAPPDPASVQLPELGPITPEVINEGGKFFAFVNPSLTYAQAFADVAECRSFLPTGVFRSLPSFVPWEEPSNRPPIFYRPVGLAAGILVSIIMPKLERGQRNNKLRRCMGPRGYRRVAIPEAAWQVLNDGDETQLIAKQAKLATLSGLRLQEVTE